jgi:hypothetical protein
LIQAAEVTDKHGNLVKLVQLRNPWGRFEWFGDWGDDSDLWTPQLIRQLNFSKNVNDGLFWMNFDDFRKYFSRMSICKYQDAYKFNFT